MTNKEISENNSEKELTIDKSISDDTTKQISKKNTAQNKKIGPKNNKSNKSFDEISNEIYRDLVLKKDSFFEKRSLKISLEISSKDLVVLSFFSAIFLFCVVFFLLICLVLLSEIELSAINSFSGLL